MKNTESSQPKTLFQVPEKQASAGTVDPIDVQKYGMARATEIAIRKAEDKARFDSQSKIPATPAEPQS